MPVLVIIVLLGWVSYGFSILDVGPYSLTLIHASVLLLVTRLTFRSSYLWLWPLLSTLMAVIVSWFAAPEARTLTNAAQQILALVFAAGIFSIEWRKHLELLTRALVAFAVPIVSYGGYQVIARYAHLPFAFLPVTNQQEFAEGGLQRGWEKDVITRASSIFVEPSEFGYFCVWLLAAGLATERKGLRFTAVLLAATGILFSQSLSAVIAAAILFLVYLCTRPIDWRMFRHVAILLAVASVCVTVFAFALPDVAETFSERIGHAMALDDRADSDRVSEIPRAWKLFVDAPITGSGLASLPREDNAGAIAYAQLLVERGVVGTLLFLVPWAWVAIRSFLLPRGASGRTLAILISVLSLFSLSTFSAIYYLPFWFSLGVCASLACRPCSMSQSSELPNPCQS